MARIMAGLMVLLLSITALGQEEQEVYVAPGESLQKAIDAAPDGAILLLGKGTYTGRISITKPVTIRGMGWEDSILEPEPGRILAGEDLKRFIQAVDGDGPMEQRKAVTLSIMEEYGRTAIKVNSTIGVRFEKIKIQGGNGYLDDRQTAIQSALIEMRNSTAKFSDCAILGPFKDGISLLSASQVEVSQCLVAGFWSTGIRVGSNDTDNPDAFSRLHLADSVVRNCYLGGINLRGMESIIERCQISGSAWHGIFYDDCSPTITGNHIFGNARCGVYASGTTKATVRDNIFEKNEMSGMSCWDGNNDLIEGNLFSENIREGIGLSGNSKPLIQRNKIIGSPAGIACFRGAGRPEPVILENTFKTEIAVKRYESMKYAQRPDENEATADDVQLLLESRNIILPVKDAAAWPLQHQELDMIPQGETRDYREWKKVPGEE